MKREIKFRGKRVDNGEWVYGMPLTYRDGHVAIYDGLLMLYGSEATTLSRHKVDPATVGQFTGLLDRAGVEIYEGDKLGRMNGYYTVFFDKENASFTRSNSTGGRLTLTGDTYKVIGNIHDEASACLVN